MVCIKKVGTVIGTDGAQAGNWLLENHRDVEHTSGQPSKSSKDMEEAARRLLVATEKM